MMFIMHGNLCSHSLHSLNVYKIATAMDNPIEKHSSMKTNIEKNDLDLHPKTTIEVGDAPSIVLKHADRNDADAALMAFKGHEGETIVMTVEMERKLLRKIDWNIMPVFSNDMSIFFHS